MRVLIACEESGRVRDAFRARGHDAWSVDILPTRADPAWHITALVEEVLKWDQEWDLMVAFPPCTDLALSGARHWAAKQADGRQQRSMDLFMYLAEGTSVPRVAIENPVGIMSRAWRKPDQIIQPWQFGDPWKKMTCLWLKGLPALVPTGVVEHHGRMEGWHGNGGPKYRELRQRLRSQTYPGIARAMADQWG